MDLSKLIANGALPVSMEEMGYDLAERRRAFDAMAIIPNPPNAFLTLLDLANGRDPADRR